MGESKKERTSPGLAVAVRAATSTLSVAIGTFQSATTVVVPAAVISVTRPGQVEPKEGGMLSSSAKTPVNETVSVLL